VFTPITRPRPSSSGPPELPGLIAASVCTTRFTREPSGASMLRRTDETTPSVSVRSSPSGLPIASAVSPTRTSRESPSGSGLNFPRGRIFSSARSFERSRPTTRARYRLPPPRKRIVTTGPPAITWAFVTIEPRWSIRKPLPVATPSSRLGRPSGSGVPRGRASMRTTPSRARA
jgi:hypothetical protein